MRKLLLIIFAFVSTITFAYCTDVIIESKRQTLNLERNKGLFEGDVKVQINDVVITGPRAVLDLEPTSKKPSLATFYDNPYAFQDKQNKKHEIKAKIIKVSLIKKHLSAEGNTQSIISENRKPIVTVNADSQEYDTASQIMSAKGGVIIYYKELETFSNAAVVKIDKEGEIQKLELIGNAILKEKSNVVKGDKFVYNPLTEEYLVSGNTTSDVMLDDGTRVYTQANYQQFDKRASNLIAGGNVRIKFRDYFARGPKAQVFPNAEGKPNEIVFSGRSKITQGSNTVEADRIKLTLNPKNFFAEGNVKTTITGGSKVDIMP